MQLLASVNAGFQACPNGWVELYIRGSSTRATWYAAFEGSGANSTGSNITLDSYGSAEVYVNQLVDVVVKQSDGTLYRQYTDGYSSPNVEVRSNSFTGTDYNTAVVAPGNPTTLQAVLDKWIVSAGSSSVDWQVYYRGSTHTLSELAGVIGGLVINVQSAAYGAVGDGTTDDTSAILNALAAALLALNGNSGVTVFFPKGNYRITSVITWDYRVNIVMVPGSTLAIDSATAGTIQFTAANTTNYETVFFGVGFKALQANTGVALSIAASQKLTLVSCQFGGSALDTGTQVNLGATISKLTLQRCRFSINGPTQSAIGSTSGSIAQMIIRDCEFVTPATYNGVVISGTSLSVASTWSISGCKFDGTTNATATGATDMWLRPGAFVDMRFHGNLVTGNFTYGLLLEGGTEVIGNEFSGTGISVENDGTSATIVGNRFTSSTTAISFSGNKTIAYGNSFNSVTNRYPAIVVATGSFLEMDKIESFTNPGAAFTLGKFVEYSEVTLNLAPTVTIPAGNFYGQLRRALFKNPTGAPLAVGLAAGASRVTSLSTTTAPAGGSIACSFIYSNLTGDWVLYHQA